MSAGKFRRSWTRSGGTGRTTDGKKRAREGCRRLREVAERHGKKGYDDEKDYIFNYRPQQTIGPNPRDEKMWHPPNDQDRKLIADQGCGQGGPRSRGGLKLLPERSVVLPQAFDCGF
jgi:hypothetical protein